VSHLPISSTVTTMIWVKSLRWCCWRDHG
jgi:hypothetical protein